MTFVLHCHDPHTLETSGGKAFALYRALNAELPVPPWFTLTPSAYEASTSVAPSEEVQSAIANAIDNLRNDVDDRYAVRSSACDEDGFQYSFAGQLESYLNVTADEVPARVTDVWQSSFSERVMSYRQERAVDSSSSASAVIVQRMVDADSAGVAFSADPVSGRRGVTVISCIRGLGEALVSGETDADTWEIDRFGRILSCTLTDPETPVLTPNEAKAVAALARRSQIIFGSPQDIEWAIEDGRLWLLQSRPITTLHNLSDPDGLVRVWDNSNIAESYGGVTSPLTYTFARRAYEEVYRQFCVLMRVPSSVIGAHADTFRCMIGLLRGRVYYNLVSWHKVLALLPGYKMNRE
ncbi:MAG TPA: phosphoenolpyruvate synthase, partial [Gammaproteobacteria bacterium]|nr:phosphoenolpyruvate synthase [Gammaproteobacteria bacterium]